MNRYGYSALGTLGALPTLLPESGGDKGGIWHRDAYSMWDKEALDLVSKTVVNFSLKTRNFVLKMINLAGASLVLHHVYRNLY